MLENLEKELRKWRQDRATTKPQSQTSPPDDRRTVKVNGQEVAVVVRKKLKPRS
jgi:hypothetical protein